MREHFVFGDMCVRDRESGFGEPRSYRGHNLLCDRSYDVFVSAHCSCKLLHLNGWLCPELQWT